MSIGKRAADKTSHYGGPRADGGLQVAVGAAITRTSARFADCRDTLKLVLLQNTQEGNLGLSWKLSDFVEEACLHLLAQTDQALLTRAGEGTFSWPNNSDAIRSRGIAAQSRRRTDARPI